MGLWRSRTGRESPKASFNPLPIEAFATETASSYPNPVEESYKVDQVFCNLVDKYGENRRHKFVSRSFERPPQFSSYQCNEERVPDMADMQLWKGGLTSYAGAEWLRTRSSRHLRGMQQVRTVVWSPQSRDLRTTRQFSCQECCTSSTFWFWGTACVGQYWIRLSVLQESLPSSFL